MEKVKHGIEKFFRIKERNTTISRELLGGLTIFLAMFYILPVNSFMLGVIPGSSIGAIFAATAISAAIATLIMGLYANFPVALAPGMGLNVFFTYTICGAMGYSYGEALALVFISGIIFLIISLTKLRTVVLKAIPKNLKLAVGAGIGFFIAFIGLKNAGIIVASSSTLIGVGDLSKPVVLLGVAGIVLVLILSFVKSKISRFSVIISMIIIALVGGVLGLCGVENMPSFSGSDIGSVTDIKDTFGLFVSGLKTVFGRPESYAIIFSLLFVDFFDTAGTLVAVGTQANFVTKEGEILDSQKALLADSIGTVVGAACGTSTVTSFIESTTGIESGSRTGLTSATVGVLFLLSLFIYPLLGIFGSVMIEEVAYSPVTSLSLVYVGILMFKQLQDIDWKDTVAVSSVFVVLIFMILGNSISTGIIFGFLTYTLLMLIFKRRKEVSPIMFVLSVLFIVDLIIEHFVL